MKFILLFLNIIFNTIPLIAQFAPPAGQEGTTAIPADSSIFVAWATNVEMERGWQYIVDESLGKVEAGEPSAALGMADSPSIVSLGDGGSATLTFDYPIRNGEGFDFAVFENSFDGLFLELAFVEVSSDGENFIRFPATSNTTDDADIGPFGLLDATKINNLAGKYKGLFGTPFDLAELTNIANLDVENITHVRIMDVVGSTNENYATFDQNGNAINDPFPTPFPSGGFDLDAVGVIYQNDINGAKTVDNQGFEFDVFPNPVKRNDYLTMTMKGKFSLNNGQFLLINAFGKVVKNSVGEAGFYLENLESGVYFLQGEMEGKLLTKRVVVID